MLLLLIIYLRKELKDLRQQYNLQEEIVQSAKRIADDSIYEANEFRRRARIMEQLATAQENRTKEELQLQKLNLEARFALEAQGIRREAVQKAKVINKGFDGETFSPLLQKNWTSKDFRHIGDPIDFLVLAGAEAIRSDFQEEIDNVVLLEIKTGSSDLNKVQRRIRDAVVSNKVQFAVYNPDTKTTRIWSSENPKGKDESGQTPTSESTES